MTTNFMSNDYTYKMLLAIVGKTVAEAESTASGLGLTTQIVVEDGVRISPDADGKVNLTVDGGNVTSYVCINTQ